MIFRHIENCLKLKMLKKKTFLKALFHNKFYAT